MSDFSFNETKDVTPFTYFTSEISGTIGDKSDTSQTDETKSSFFQLDYYRKFFDVDQDQVLMRILNSFYPKQSGNYITDYVQPKPDLYGPFWISATLIFAVAIFGDLSTFIQNYANGVASEHIGDFEWVTAATSLVFSYVVVAPAIIYFFQIYRNCDVQYGYFEILCMYGYSLFLFIPVTALWFLLPFYWLRWFITISTVAATGHVIAQTLWQLVRNDKNFVVKLGFIAGVVLTHFFLILCFKEYFFSLSANALLQVEPSSLDGRLINKVTEHM